MHSSNVGAESGRVCVFGDWHEDLDVVGRAAAFELGFCLSGISVLAVFKETAETVRTFSMYSIRDPECDSTKHSTQINGFTCVFNR